jgi:dephospho-CoA kinase
MGKSACAQLLSARGVPIVDTDDLARRVVEPGQPALGEVVRLFGGEIVDANGRLRRRELARRVFADPAKRKELEDILHPRIRSLWLAQVEQWEREGRPLVVVVIPLLFETGAEKELDAVICVACSGKTQQKRLQVRGWPAEQIEQRIAAQWPVETKMLKSNYAIWTEGNLDVHAAQLDRILERLR